ncbi:response regulator transcription factor [Halarcobacter anaerophilus]|uniref:DNA-binding response regulator n=1 Tax=Halarcobacter anaerophilus TaxID=877500 RepID=A0A4Q0Y104_9BACT|nr:response regulator [Halarcobacter anaerophilus]QDF30049.1 signal transduction response regulator, OmpR family [Halarcobacter anaerophilus]RXJ63095.1 DNA-binding response regulator [Halarcobacter anaerophilus]
MKLNNLFVLYVFDKTSSKNEVLSLLEKKLKKVFIANSLKQAQSCYRKYSPCIIIVDDSFFDNTMVKFLQEIRQSDIKTAFLVLSNNKTNKYLYELMELYITKYILKPFKKEELLLGLEKSLEVIESRIYSNVNLGRGILFNFQTQSITKEGKVFILNKKESILVNLFIQNSNRVITYEELAYHIWDNECTSAALKSLIRDFRKKTYKTILQNYSGIGYKLNIQN